MLLSLMKIYLFFGVSLLVGANSFSRSLLQCTGNQNIRYQKKNNTGGMRPPAGSIRQIEEITSDSEVLYRLVSRIDCNEDPDCVLQDPELVDVVPDDFSFSFYPETKVFLTVSGTPMDPVFKETYAVQFRINRRPNVWMICDLTQMLNP